MNKNELIQSLKELQLELQRSHFLHEADRTHLEQLVEDLEAQLARSPDESIEGAPYHTAVTERLRDATQRFEVTHPQLTVVLARVIHTLTNMGI